MTETPDLLALRDGLPEGPWEQYAADALVVRAGKIWIANAWTVKIARAIAAIPSMLEEIARLQNELAEFESESHRDYQSLESELGRISAFNTELREALQQAVTVLESNELNGLFAFAAMHGYRYTGPIVDRDKARAILTKTETTP